MLSRLTVLLGLALIWITPSALAADFDAASAINATGLKIYGQLASEAPDKNLVLSPYSIESALALAYVGADGPTREQMSKALQLRADDHEVAASFKALRQQLERTKGEGIEWHAANRLFGQTGHAFREAFMKQLRDEFAAPFEPMNFRRESEKARIAINRWVSDTTRERIRDLFPAGSLNDETRLVLVNALYFKGDWHEAFDRKATRTLPFRLHSGELASVPMMRQTVACGYARETEAQVLSLAYKGRTLHCLIILPDVGVDLDGYVRSLSAADFSRWNALGKRKSEVALTLPKFRTPSESLPLGKALRALGIHAAFDDPPGSADFSRIAPKTAEGYLFLSEVFHKTFVAVDEEGTEAAAATGAVMARTLSYREPIQVRVDRPFLFAIQDQQSGTCLFLGRIADPR